MLSLTFLLLFPAENSIGPAMAPLPLMMQNSILTPLRVQSKLVSKTMLELPMQWFKKFLLLYLKTSSRIAYYTVYSKLTMTLYESINLSYKHNKDMFN